MANGEVYIMAERAALNLSYQDKMPVTGRPELLLTVKGTDLLGLPVKVRLRTQILQIPMRI